MEIIVVLCFFFRRVFLCFFNVSPRLPFIFQFVEQNCNYFLMFEMEAKKRCLVSLILFNLHNLQEAISERHAGKKSRNSSPEKLLKMAIPLN